MDGRIYQGVGRKMIKVETKDGFTDVEMEGASGVIASDLMVIVAAVYNGLVKEKPEQKDALKNFIKRMIASDMVFNAQEDGDEDGELG
jgi:hypothetical protein